MTEEVKNAVEDMAKAFEEFKATNDQRLKALEKKGSVDPLVTDKIKKIEETMDGQEDLNQEITLQKQSLNQIHEKMDNIETMLKRPDVGLEAKQVDASLKAFDSYLRKGEAQMGAEEI